MPEESPENTKSSPTVGSNSRFVVLSDQAIVSATNFLTSIIVGNACGAEKLGVYAVGFSIVLLAMAVETSFVSTPFTVMAQSPNDRNLKRRIGGSLANLLIVNLIILLVLLVAWLIARQFLLPEYDLIFQTVILTTPFFTARNYARKVLLATFRARSLLLVDCLACGCQVLILWLLSSWQSFSPSMALLVAGGSNLVGFLLYIVFQSRNIEFDRRSIREQAISNWNFGKWLVGEQVLTIISLYGSPWLFVILLDSDSAGVFAACFSITGLANPFLIGLGNYLLPRFSSEFANKKYSQYTYWSYMALTFLVVGLFAICCAIWPDVFLEFFYPDDSYSGFGQVLAILTIRTLIGSLGLIAHYALLAMQKPMIGLYASLVAITIFFGASLVLIPWFGIIGGALAWSLTAVVESLFMIVAFHKLMKAEFSVDQNKNAQPGS